MIGKIQTIISKVKKAEIREDDAAADVDEWSSSSVEHKIKAIMAKLFKIDMGDINEETTADDIDQWNSLGHVDLLVNLQNEFEIEFTDSQLVEMQSYKTVVQSVKAAITGTN